VAQSFQFFVFLSFAERVAIGGQRFVFCVLPECGVPQRFGIFVCVFFEFCREWGGSASRNYFCVCLSLAESEGSLSVFAFFCVFSVLQSV